MKERIKFHKEEKNQKELQELTFQPDITKNKLECGHKKPTLEKSMKAVDQYIQRMQKAKDEEQRK